MRYFKKLTGERIYLSPMNKDDAEVYTKWFNDVAVSGFLGQFSSVISLESEQRFLERMTTEGCNFAIVRLSDDTLIGNISLMDIKHINRTAIVGIFIGEAENRGKGYGSEAMKLILNYGFNTLNLHNIALTVHGDNEQGLACYKKVGFREYGRRHQSLFKDGKYVDLICMEILDSEFCSAL